MVYQHFIIHIYLEIKILFYTHIKVYVENREIGYLILHVKIFYPSILVYEKN